MKNFILGWLLGKVLADSDNTGENGFVELIANVIVLLFILAGIGIWYKLCVWIASFAGPLGPFVGVFVPITLMTLSQSGCKSSSELRDTLLVCAILSVLFILFIMWHMDYI